MRTQEQFLLGSSKRPAQRGWLMRINQKIVQALAAITLATAAFSAQATPQTGYFIYDEAGHLIGEYDSNGNAIQEHIYLGDRPVAVVQGQSRSVGYVTTDQLNTPRVITDSSPQANIEWSWTSDPFGNGQPTGSLTYNLRFPGQYYDAETGHNYNYHRDYDPTIGRYIESDPINLRGGANTYTYVLGNPLRGLDPSGLITWTGILTSVGVIYGGGAVKFNVHLTSECVNGKKAVVDILAGGFALGAGFEPSFTATDITFKDNNSDIEPDVFSGTSYYADFGFVNANISYLRLGGATSAGPGETNGVDLGISGGAGISDVRDSHWETCDCQKK